MIAILKINSADIINELQSDTLALCLIPPNTAKYKLSEIPILKEIINQNVDVEEKTEPIDPDDYISKSDLPNYFWTYIKNCITDNNFPTPEQLDPDNYYLKSSLPTFLNKFVAYALTEPAGITAETYAQTCELLQAEPRLLQYGRIYNYPHRLTPISQRYLTSVSGGMYGIAPSTLTFPSITSDGYYLPNNCILSTNQSQGDIATYIYLESLVKFTSTSASQMIISWYNSNATTDSLQGAYLSKTASNKIMFWARRSTVTGGSISLVSDTSNLDISKDVGVTLVNGQGAVTLKTMHYTSNSDEPIYQMVTQDSDYMKAFPTIDCGIRIGGRIYKSGATVNSTITGAKYFKKLFYSNEDKNPVVNIFYPDSNTINEKLLMIV